MSVDQCACLQPRLWECENKGEFVGEDMTHSRYGDVWLYRCPDCCRNWLFYRVDYPSYSRSGRWFRAVVPAAATRNIKPEDAERLINASDYRVVGGSLYASPGIVQTGPAQLPFDL